MTANYKKMHTFKPLSIFLIFIAVFVSVAQLRGQTQIQKEVRVVKPYTPTLSDANKISLLPEFNDTSRVTANFNYVIFPRRYDTDYKVDPIKPAKMVGMPIPKLYKSQLTLGAGNYNSPLMELTVNQLRAKTTQLGFYFNHHSSGGKIKLDNNKKVDAGFSDNLARVYGKKIFEKALVEGDISGGYNSVHYYGYNTAIDTALDRDKIKQKFYTAGGNVKVSSIHPDSSHLNYKAQLNYEFANDVFKNTEHVATLGGSVNKKVNKSTVGSDLIYKYVGYYGSVDTARYSVLDVNPWFSKSSNEWKFLLGFDLNYDESQRFITLYPKASFEFNIVPRVLIPYVGVTGYNEVNTYRKIFFENPFITPGTGVQNTNHLLVVYAGLKGRYSDKVAFNLMGNYDKIDSLYFFVNDKSNILGNNFIPVYDAATVINLEGELSWHQSEKLDLMFRADYYEYQLAKLEHPWHKPALKATLSADYNLRDKILVGADLFFTGKRYAQGAGGIVIDLNGYLDANLSLEYRYTKLLSFFLRFNNLTAARYQEWNQYPVQRFQFLAGFTYAL
jgi:hypothetical protein